jgi:hypothetical protein
MSETEHLLSKCGFIGRRRCKRESDDGGHGHITDEMYTFGKDMSGEDDDRWQTIPICKTSCSGA